MSFLEAVAAVRGLLGTIARLMTYGSGEQAYEVRGWK